MPVMNAPDLADALHRLHAEDAAGAVEAETIEPDAVPFSNVYVWAGNGYRSVASARLDVTLGIVLELEGDTPPF